MSVGMGFLKTICINRLQKLDKVISCSLIDSEGEANMKKKTSVNDWNPVLKN